MLVRETASALGAFTSDPAGLVTACRRIVDRHPASASLWWLCARVLTAEDPRKESWAAADDIEQDPTSLELSLALPDEGTLTVLGWPELVSEALPRRGDVEVLVIDTLGEGSGMVRRLLAADVDAVDVPLSGLGAAVADSDLVLLEATALGPDGFIGVAGSRAAAAVARHAGVPVWLVSGVGRMLPGRIWERVCGLLDASGDPWDADDEVVPLDLVDRVVGPRGPEEPADAVRHVDCPIAPELLRGAG